MNIATLGSKIEQLAVLKTRKKELSDLVRENNAELEAQEREIISDMCDMAEAAGLESIEDFSVVVNGRKYGVIRKAYYSIKAEDRDAGFAALRTLGLGDLIVESVDSRSLTKVMNEIAEENGGELPEQYAAIPMQQYDKDTISDRKVGR